MIELASDLKYQKHDIFQTEIKLKVVDSKRQRRLDDLLKLLKHEIKAKAVKAVEP